MNASAAATATIRSDLTLWMLQTETIQEEIAHLQLWLLETCAPASTPSGQDDNHTDARVLNCTPCLTQCLHINVQVDVLELIDKNRSYRLAIGCSAKGPSGD